MSRKECYYARQTTAILLAKDLILHVELSLYIHRLSDNICLNTAGEDYIVDKQFIQC